MLHATTGSGKTYAVWFGLLNRALAGEVPGGGLLLPWLTPMLRSSEGHHLFVYPFARPPCSPRAGVSAGLPHRPHAGGDFSIAINDYGFELLSPWGSRLDGGVAAARRYVAG